MTGINHKLRVHTEADAGTRRGKDHKNQKESPHGGGRRREARQHNTHKTIATDCPHRGGRRRRARQQTTSKKICNNTQKTAHTEADAGAKHGNRQGNTMKYQQKAHTEADAGAKHGNRD